MSLHGLVDPTPAEAGVEARLVACAGDTTKVIDLSQRDVGAYIENRSNSPSTLVPLGQRARSRYSCSSNTTLTLMGPERLHCPCRRWTLRS